MSDAVIVESVRSAGARINAAVLPLQGRMITGYRF
jgi:hypothetical protein